MNHEWLELLIGKLYKIAINERLQDKNTRWYKYWIDNKRGINCIVIFRDIFGVGNLVSQQMKMRIRLEVSQTLVFLRCSLLRETFDRSTFWLENTEL